MDFKVVDLIKFYFKNIMLVLLSFGISLGIGYYYFFEVYESEYVANTTIMLGANEESTDIGFNQKVINNYLELVKSKNVIDYTINKTGLDYTNSQLKGMISASFAEDTEFITISVISKDKDDVAKLSYAVYEGLVAEVERIFKINNIHLVDTDSVGDVIYSDNLLLLVVLGLSFGVSFCVTTINYLFFPQFNLQKIVNNLKNNIKEKRVIRKKVSEERRKQKILEQEMVNKKDTTKKGNKKRTETKDKTIEKNKTIKIKKSNSKTTAAKKKEKISK